GGWRWRAGACGGIGRAPADRFAAEAESIADALAPFPPCTDYRHAAQTFLAPRSLAALLDAMEEFPDAVLLAGGTDLGLRVAKDREPLPAVIATPRVPPPQPIPATAA